MISTKDLSCMLKPPALRTVCRGMAALDIIMGKEEYIRYYSYNPNWGADEEVFEMADGSSQRMLILFGPHGCVISGIDEDLYDWKNNSPKIEDLTKGLPAFFYEFMFEEPVKSLKSTFCIWNTDGVNWNRSMLIADEIEDGSNEMLSALDGNPQTYVDFCEWYYEKDIPVYVVEKIFGGEPITLDMIKSLNPDREDIDVIKKELLEMGYPTII